MTTWIRVAEEHPLEVGQRPVYLVRREFDLSSVPASATLRISAHGIYTAYINGRRVGNDELTPGYTEYSVRTQFQTYSVEDLLLPGANAIVVELADGWYRGAVGATQVGDQYGTSVGIWAELIGDSVHGSGQPLVSTDAEWVSRPSHILSGDLFRGQVEDLRSYTEAAYLPGATGLDWQPTAAYQYTGRLVAQACEPTRVVEYLKAKAIKRLGPTTQVVDFGQNSNGWVRLAKLGPAGTTIKITHGEALDASGDVTTEHLDVNFPIFPEPIKSHQVDVVISDGKPGSVFEPRFTTHGFQYVRVEGLVEDLQLDDISSAVVHTDLRRIGYFQSSDERINWLHDAAVWSFRGNACDVPTDCPTRERAGWTGDWQLYSPTAAFLYDVREFNRKFLTDVRLLQEDSGRVLNIAPRDRISTEGFAGKLNGSAGWGDVVVHAPWAMWREYGDQSQLEENFDAMEAWLDFAASTAASGRHPSRENKPKKPFEDFLWDTGFHWGEWLEPNNPQDDFGAFLASDKGIVATAYLYRSALEAAEAAQVIGRPANVVQRYRDLAANALRAWRDEYLNADGSLTQPTQANYVRALSFNMVPDELVPSTAGLLAAAIAANDYRLDTGFLATPMLLPVLAENGFLDLAYRVLLQEQEPSWLAMRNRGATTMWERWNGVDSDGVPHESLNHYSKGAVVSFLHQYTAGLKPIEPGYRRFSVAPMPNAALDWIELSLNSAAGLIEVAWKRVERQFTLEVVVPAGAEAVIQLPNGDSAAVTEGAHTFSCSL